MNISLARMAASLLAGVGLALLGAGAALATDDYTLPFYDPAVILSYGVDRDRTLDRQLDWTGQIWNDGDPHFGRVYDQHTRMYKVARIARSAVVSRPNGGTNDDRVRVPPQILGS
jgi:hypothetical protein